MKELINTFLETSKERIKNPFIGAFCFAWIVMNWKPILYVLLSSDKISDKITNIELKYSSLSNTLTFPVLLALFYVILLPYIMWFIEELVKKSTKGRKNNIVNQLLLDIKGKQKLAIEEINLEDIKSSFQEKSELNNELKSLRNKLSRKDDDIKELNNKITELNTSISNYRELMENDKYEVSLNMETEQDKLDYILFKGTDMFENFRDIGLEIKNKGRFPVYLDKFIIEKYLVNEIVSPTKDVSGKVISYAFTNKGEAFWKEYVLDSLKKDESIKP